MYHSSRSLLWGKPLSHGVLYNSNPCFHLCRLCSDVKWILTGEVELEEPLGKACRTRACGKLVVSTQVEALPQSYPAPESFPRSEPETTERYIVIIIDDDINNPSLKLSGIQMRPGTGEFCALMLEVVSSQSQPQVLTLTCGSHGPSVILGKEDNTQPQRIVHGSGTYRGNAQEQQNEHRVEGRDSEGGELGNAGLWERFIMLGAQHVCCDTSPACTLETSVLWTAVLISDDDIIHTSSCVLPHLSPEPSQSSK